VLLTIIKRLMTDYRLGAPKWCTGNSRVTLRATRKDAASSVGPRQKCWRPRIAGQGSQLNLM
jgi:hypothetical protein